MGRITLDKVSKRFGDVEVIPPLDLTIEDGEFTVFVGPSGCGKSTLLRLIAGLEDTSGGQIRIDKQDATNVPPAKRGLAMVFQSARLLPWRSVLGNIEFVLALRGLSRTARRERSLGLLGAVGLRDFAEAFPHELSGGMQQRVGLARALAVEPDVLLMDEPFAALDAMTRETLRAELLKLWARRGTAIVFVTHDIDEAILLSQRIVLLRPRPGAIDTTLTVDLPEPRWETDPRADPRFAALRADLWNRIHAMSRDGAELEELAYAFDPGTTKGI